MAPGITYVDGTSKAMLKVNMTQSLPKRGVLPEAGLPSHLHLLSGETQRLACHSDYLPGSSSSMPQGWRRAMQLRSRAAAAAFRRPPGNQMHTIMLDLLPQKVLGATWPPPAGSGLHGRCQVATFWILTLLEFASGGGGGDTPVHKVPISVKADVSTLLAEFSSREACS